MPPFVRPWHAPAVAPLFSPYVPIHVPLSRGPVRVPYHPMAAAMAQVQHPAIVHVRPITAANHDAQMNLIASLLQRFPIVVVDTEYPGTVHRPAEGRRNDQLTPDERYELAKANVDELRIVQLGLTLCDEQGRLPVVVDEHGSYAEVAWEVNFSDFDVRHDRHAAESVAFLRSQGVEFDLAHAYGVSTAAFSHRLVGMLSNHRELTWATFGGIYDLGYLLKILSGGEPLPETKELFMAEVRARLGKRVFDAKYMAEHCESGDLRGVGLKQVARNLGLPQHFPEPPYLAGPKSFLACRIFMAMRRRIFQFLHDNDTCYEGLIDGMQ